MLYLWALLFWLGLLVVAILLATVRELLLTPAMGDSLARALATLILCGVDLALIRLFVTRTGATATNELIGLGAFLTLLTLLFEFGFGHYLRGVSWEVLLADWNILRGRLWPLVPLTTLLGPLLARRLLP